MKKKMKVAMNLKGLNVHELLLRGKQILSSCENNQRFTTPIPLTAELKAALEEFDKAIELAAEGGKKNVIARNDASEVVTNLITEIAHFIEDRSEGDLELIHSAGFEVRKTRSLINMKETANTNYYVKQGVESGSVILKHPNMGNRVTYHWEISIDKNGPWSVLKESTKSKIIVGGLSTEKRQWFRAYYIDIEGSHAYTEPISLMVL